MPCLCTTNTLRLFLKNVAQVDSPSSTIRSSSGRWQSTALRNFSSSQTSRSEDIAFARGPPEVQEQGTGPKAWPQGWTEPGTAQSTEGDAEVRSAPVISSVKKLSKNARRREARYGASATPQDAARRTRTVNPGSALHSSSPRPPLAGKAEQAERVPDARPKTNTFRPTKEGDDWKPPPREHWQLDKAALKEKFPDGWKPMKKLSPDALMGIRALHAQSPELHTTEILANKFKISSEAIRRILKSKWRPDAEEETDRARRWLNRGKSIYTRHAELGQKPPKIWRDMGIGQGKPDWMLRKQRSREKIPLPALITTSRARDVKYGVNRSERLEDTRL